LWTERGADPAKLTQIWFAGVHANVGGGYPDDGLAYVTLQWMMDEAEAAGLRFYPAERQAVDCRADCQGEQYDSRSGLAGYYRYGPRIVDRLCNDAGYDVFVAKPKIHDSAQKRIGARQVAYAPVSFPTDYEAVGRAGNLRAPLRPMPLLENLADLARRISDIESAWDAVWRKRLAYFATVALSLVLVAFPVLERLGWLRPACPAGNAWARGLRGCCSRRLRF
jgi:hypothetical protein